MFSYEIDERRRLIRCCAAGKLDFLQTTQTLRQLLCNHVALATSDTLLVIADGTAAMDVIALRSLKPILIRWSEMQSGRRWAVVFPNETARTFAETSMPQLPVRSVTVMCFSSESAARSWLETCDSSNVNLQS